MVTTTGARRALHSLPLRSHRLRTAANVLLDNDKQNLGVPPERQVGAVQPVQIGPALAAQKDTETSPPEGKHLLQSKITDHLRKELLARDKLARSSVNTAATQFDPLLTVTDHAVNPYQLVPFVIIYGDFSPPNSILKTCAQDHCACLHATAQQAGCQETVSCATLLRCNTKSNLMQITIRAL